MHKDTNSTLGTVPPLRLVAIGMLLGALCWSRPSVAAPASDETVEDFAREAAAFRKSAESYHETVNAIVKRSYQMRRKKLLGRFDKEIRKEETEERTRRLAAITLFEDFLRRYPNDKRWSPDVIFRLAELYFEKSNDRYLQETEQYEKELQRFERKEIAQAPAPPRQDYRQTIGLHRRLIKEFPEYRLVDGAYYLLGFCLSEMGQEQRGNQAFLSLVCSNNYKAPLSGLVAAEGDSVRNKLLSEAPPSDPNSLNLNAYGECRPLRADSRFNAEAWIRIGEYHFDENQLGEAIAAYRRVLAIGPKKNPYYDEAMYKLAWTYYRADRFLEAIKYFDQLVAYADAEYQRTGKAGSEMRPESIQYLGVSFAEDDWDGDTLPDITSGLQRIDSFYKERAKEKHVYEVYRRLADIYFDTTKYDQSIEVYRLLMQRWPYHATNPEAQDKIILAMERQRRFDDAIREREEFTRLFGKGTEWERQNRNNPAALKKAREFDEQALIQAAVFHHRQGQELKKRGVAMADPETLQKASQEYSLAAVAYKKYLDRFPDGKNAYEIRYSYASCLFYSERFVQAAEVFAAVRDSNLDDRFRDEAAFSAAKAYEEEIKRQVAAGKLSTPPAPTVKQPPASLKPLVVPELYANWQRELDLYARLLPKSPKAPQVAYNAADISYRHLNFEDARVRFAKIYKAHCKTTLALNAAQSILVSYQLEKNLDKMQEWATELSKGRCVVGPEGQKALAGSKALLEGIKFKKARQLHQKGDDLSAKKKFDAAAPYYDRAAAAYLALVDESPRSADADKALNNAAVCYEGSRRFESATRIYERVWQQYPDSPLAGEALWRAAVNYQRFFEFGRAVQNYLILADSPRFKASKRRNLAVFNAAAILENDQDYARSAQLFLRYASTVEDPKEAASAYFRAGLIYEKMRNFSKMMRVFRAFSRKYGSVEGQGGRVVEAAFRIARQAQTRKDWRTAQRYYRQAIAGFSGASGASGAAEYAAYAAFQLAEHKLEDFLKRKLRGSLKAINVQKKQMERAAIKLKGEYQQIWTYKWPKWTLAAMYREGSIMEHYARAVAAAFRSAPIPKKVRRLGQEAIDIYQSQVDELLEQQVRPLEEAAKTLYLACVNKAKEFGISNRYTEEALARLNAFDPTTYPLLKRAKVELLVN